MTLARCLLGAKFKFKSFIFQNCQQKNVFFINIMSSAGDFNVQNFRSLVKKYETVIQDVTNELSEVQAEQNTIKESLKENSQLSAQLNKILSEKVNNPPEHKYKNVHFVENLQLQLKTLLEEKEQAIKLWQNAASTVDFLETELRTYQNSSEGLVPKAKLDQIKKEYEAKIKILQENVSATKMKLEQLIELKTQELKAKDKEIASSLQSHDNTFKIVKNLESEVLKLQERLNEVTSDKKRLEKNLKVKGVEIDNLKEKVKECRLKVEESLQVVEAALNEKDAALLRETKVKEELAQLTTSLEDVMKETNVKLNNMKAENDKKLEQMLQELKNSQEEVKIYAQKCSFLEEQIQRLKKGIISVDESGASKMLTLEKNLESTFQKLLLSEKQNIQLKSEMESIKSDLDQMAHLYERDVTAREVEKSVLKDEIRKLKFDLDESCIKLSNNEEIIMELNKKMSSTKMELEREIRFIKEEQKKEQEALETEYKKTVEELQMQLTGQIKINRKWRTETKKMMDEMEKRIKELKQTVSKVKLDNKILSDRLKDSNMKMSEYRKFMELISQDVNKITGIALPEMGEMFSILTTLMVEDKNKNKNKSQSD